MNDASRRALLLPNVSQYDVDFVIPRIGVDVPLGIDPFLLYKSRVPEYRDLHSVLMRAFNAGISAVGSGALGDARRILDFPEVSAIGLGYSRNSKRGSGVGTHLANLIIETLVGSPSLQQRGVRHIEEMQLVSAGIGPDRVSDIAANVLKRYLIGYTQRQCEIWGLRVERGIPLSHIYNPTSQSWDDSYEDLPVSPVDGSPILLVPRRLVRALPWINYDDFLRTEFNAYLNARRESARRSRAVNASRTDEPAAAKEEVVTITRSDIGLVDRYVRSREQQAADARRLLTTLMRTLAKRRRLLKRDSRRSHLGANTRQTTSCLCWRC